MLIFLSIAAFAAEPLGLTLDIGRDLLLVDGRETLTVSAIMDDGTVQTVDSGVEWTSSRADVAEISRNGVAAGLQPGVTEVVASWKGLESMALVVEVVDETPTRVHIEPPQAEVLPGARVQLELVATLADGRKASATRQATWIARYQDVADVDDGLVYGKVEGDTSVTASFRGTRAPSANVTVQIPKAVGLTVDPPISVMVVGSRVNLEARAVFATGHSLDVSKRVTWLSSSPNTLHVDGAGRMTAIRAGNARVQTSWDDLTVPAMNIEVIGGDVQKLRFVEGTRSVAAGGGMTLSVEGKVEGRWVDLTHAADWISSDELVLLTGRSGLVTGVVRGRATVTARYGSLAQAVEVVVTP